MNAREAGSTTGTHASDGGVGHPCPAAGSGDCGNVAAAARRQAFVDAAREGFFRDGYAGTTMSSISARVGGSKTTLWTYFPTKEALFAAVCDDVIERREGALSIRLSHDEPIALALQNFGLRLTRALLSAGMLALFRLVVAEADRFPDLARLYYERGPLRGKARLSAWMNEKMDRGEIRRGDPEQAANQFVALCLTNAHQKALLGIAHCDADTIAAEVDAATSTFRRAWLEPASA